MPHLLAPLIGLGILSGIASFGTNHSCGVSVIVRCSSNFSCQQISAASNGRYLLVAITHGPTAFQLLNIYAPASSAGARTDFFSDVMTLMGSRSSMVVCGDFNCVIDPTLDRQSRSRLGPRSSDINTMQTLLASLQVIDVYRKRHPITPGFTWTRQHTQTAVRLDMFLITVSATLVSSQPLLVTILGYY